MCGIVGFLDFNKCTTRDDLLAMKKTLKHRGSDGDGVLVCEEENYVFGLGHQRLSIIDLSDSGHQPMAYENFSISFNGEIYNYKEIKLALLDLGHKFQGDSDTEVILHAFQQWGISCINKFIGMFAFVIYDKQRKEVFCVRDRAGIKPFFYYFQDGLFLFASELKAFHQLDSFKKALNEDALSIFLQVGNIPAPHTIYANCFKLSPGNYLQLNTESKENFIKSMVSREYWNVYDSYNKPKLKVSFQEAKLKTEEILSSACNYRMVADVPVGIFLSGGYDSTAVTAILQNSSPQPLKTFTISVPDIGLNEADEAAKIAEFIGTDHTEINCGVKEAIDKIADLAYYYDEPFADSSAIPTMLVSEAARKSVTVALSADGGDEVFAGYNRYDYMMKYQRKFSATPKFMREIMANLMDKVSAEKLPVLRHKYNFHQRYEKLKMLLKDPSEKNFMLSLSKQFTDEDLCLILRKKNKLILTAYQSTELLKEFSTPLSFMLAIDYQTYLPDDILQKVDRATMHVGLEGREPLLDHRLIEYVAQLPDEFKYHKGVKKFLLKEIVHDLVPKVLMDRPKKGFGIPIANWMQNEIAFLLDEYLNEHDIQHQGLFNWEPINQIVAAFKAGKLEYTNKVWYLLVFQMWYKKWMK